jgi:YidC/Oxa1 family membrane protein insertase
MQGGLAQVLKVVLPMTSLVFVYFQPGAVQLFFCTGSLLSLCQTTMLRNAMIRRWLGLLPLAPKVIPGSGPTAPGGLKTWQDLNTNHISTSQANAPKNVSVVDRYVDAAKGRYTNMKETVLGKTEDRVAARKKESFDSKAEKYELTRRQQAEWDRETRNKGKVASSSNAKSGKDMIDELVDEDKDIIRPTTSKSRKRRSTGARR